jgi:MFS family permease
VSFRSRWPGAGAAPARPSWGRGDRATVGLLTGSHAVQHFYSAGLAVTYPFVVAHFHVSYATLGLVLTVAGVLSGVLQGTAGLVRRASARLLLGGQNLVLGLLSLAGAVAPGFAAFGAARCSAALAMWPQHPVGSAYLSERFPERRGIVLSWHTTGGSIGTVVVPILASAVIAAWGWRWALVVLAVPMAVGGVLVGTRLPAEPHRLGGEGRSRQVGVGGAGGGETALHLDGPGEAPRPVTAPLWPMIRRRRVVAILATGTVAAAGRGLGVLTAYVPAYLRSGVHLGTLLVGAVFTVVVAGSVIGPVVAGHLSDRVGRRPMLLLSYLGGAVALVAFGFSGPSLAALVVSGLLVGMLAYAESPLLQSLFSDALEGADARGAFGLYFAISYGVGSLWLVIMGAIIDRAGFTWAFVAMAASFVVAAGIVAGVGPGAGGGEGASPREGEAGGPGPGLEPA